jgi:hypothetical protein
MDGAIERWWVGFWGGANAWEVGDTYLDNHALDDGSQGTIHDLHSL